MKTRRQILKDIGKFGGAGIATSWLDQSLFSALPTLSAEEVNPESSPHVLFHADIEPFVRLLEETPRERLLEEVGMRIRQGTTFRECLSALLLAGIRNIQPRPVGFKFHAVLVVNSAYLASLNSPDQDRWLPLFWALDYFKSSQERDRNEGDWVMSSLVEHKVSKITDPRASFTSAMDAWDVEQTDVSVAALVRNAGAQEVFDLFCHYGARDFRDIGHKIIYVANSWRTLQTIGWRHAEPVMRSLAYALLDHQGGNPSRDDQLADRPGRRNLELAVNFREDWTQGLMRPESTREVMRALREGTWESAPDAVLLEINQGASPLSVWDAYFQYAAEILRQRPGIVTLHAMTSCNAMRHAWQHCSVDKTRRFLMLQCASFLSLFRNAAGLEGANDVPLLETLNAHSTSTTLEEVFEWVGKDREKGAQHALRWLEEGGEAKNLLAMAQRMIYLKGRDSHDYKFSSAIFEDGGMISKPYRNKFMAASTFWLKGSHEPDQSLVERTRAALG